MRVLFAITLAGLVTSEARAQFKLTTGVIDSVDAKSSAIWVRREGDDPKSPPLKVLIDRSTRLVIDGSYGAIDAIAPGDKVAVVYDADTQVAQKMQVTSRTVIEREEQNRQRLAKEREERARERLAVNKGTAKDTPVRRRTEEEEVEARARSPAPIDAAPPGPARESPQSPRRLTDQPASAPVTPTDEPRASDSCWSFAPRPPRFSSPRPHCSP